MKRQPISLAEEIAQCLKADFGTDRNARRAIGACVGAGDGAIKHWLEGRTVPHGVYLIGLMRASPRILAMVDRRTKRREQIAAVERDIRGRMKAARDALRGAR